MQVWFPEQKRLDQAKRFLWMRFGVGSMVAIMGVVQASTNFHQPSRWIQSICLASFLLVWRIRQPGESRWAYFTNARAILTNLSALAVVLSTVWYFMHRAQ
jgi:hypothetical protein